MIYLLMLLILCSCQPGLDRQPKVKEFSALAMREVPSDTVAFEQKPTERPKLTLENLKEGQKLYEIHCSVCHGLAGAGDGIAVDRGFPAPKDFAQTTGDSLEDIEQTVTSGRGKMFGVSNKLNEPQRWLVAYYVRALQIRTRLATREAK